jgi:hypothetical protein
MTREKLWNFKYLNYKNTSMARWPVEVFFKNHKDLNPAQGRAQLTWRKKL